MKKSLKKELRKLDKIGVMTLRKQMEIAEWMHSLIEQGANKLELARMMRIKPEYLSVYMTGAKSFRLSHIAGLTAMKHQLENQKEENQIVFTK